MKRIFGQRQPKAPPPTLDEATGKLTDRGDTLDEKIRKLEAQLLQYREQIRKARPGPAQDGLKRRALTVMKQKKLYEQQRDQLYNQQFNVENTAFALQSAKDSVDTVKAMQAASKEMKTTFKQSKMLNIDKIDAMNDDLADLMDYHNEIQEALGSNYAVPDMVDEDDLMDELDALESEIAEEPSGMPSYLEEPDIPDLPSVQANRPTAQGVPQQPLAAEVDDFGLPAVPQRS